MTTWTLIIFLSITNGARWGTVTMTSVPGYATKSDCEQAASVADATVRVAPVSFCIPGPR